MTILQVPRRATQRLLPLRLGRLNSPPFAAVPRVRSAPVSLELSRLCEKQSEFWDRQSPNFTSVRNSKAPRLLVCPGCGFWLSAHFQQVVDQASLGLEKRVAFSPLLFFANCALYETDCHRLPSAFEDLSAVYRCFRSTAASVLEV